MKRSTIVILLALGSNASVMATNLLNSWNHSMCFRNSINLCKEGTTWVYTTSHTASHCGCIIESDLFSTDLAKCDHLDSESCNKKNGEKMFNIYKTGENPRERIGCGCFIIQQI